LRAALVFIIVGKSESARAKTPRVITISVGRARLDLSLLLIVIWSSLNLRRNGTYRGAEASALLSPGSLFTAKKPTTFDSAEMSALP
jgi:hypothetical protein